jgi:hypothetical protein
MKTDLAIQIWDLPAAQIFVRKIGRESVDPGISRVCLFPTLGDLSNCQERLIDYLNAEIVPMRFIDLRYAQGDTPFDVLQCLLTNGQTYSYLEKMVGDPQLPAVTLVSHFESCSSEDIHAWLQTLGRWAEACRNGGAINSLLLLLPLAIVDAEQLPTEDVRLQHSVWLGSNSVLETRLLCRLVSGEVDAEAQWREYILASLAGNDLGLAGYLWDIILLEVLEIRNALVNYADQRGWTINDIQPALRNWRPVPPGQALQALPNGRGFSLLQRGWAVSTPEYGEELHSAVLAILDRRAEIDHRIWRAEAALLLPMVDDIRRRICDSSKKFSPAKSSTNA